MVWSAGQHIRESLEIKILRPCSKPVDSVRGRTKEFDLINYPGDSYTC